MAKKKDSIINEYHLNRYRPDKPQLAIHDLNRYVNKNKGKTNRPHLHSFYQVIWFKEGKGKHFVDFKAYDVFDNVIFFIAKNQVHYFDGNTDYNGVLLHFNEAFLVQNEKETAFFLKYNLFNDPYQRPSCCIGTDIDKILDEYVLQIKKELEQDEAFGKEQLLRNYLKSFLIQIQRRKLQQEKSEDQLPAIMDEKRVQLLKFVNLVI